MAKADKRTERDSLGQAQVPKEAYFGAFTVRAQSNFQISDLKAPKAFIKALGTVKLACAKANTSLGLLNKKPSAKLILACEEFINGKFNEEFLLDVFQAGAGTSYNMNANEIIANRANELLGDKKGKYTHIDPNNHVNMAQSTNDVIPTATRLAVLSELPNLLTELEKLEKEIVKLCKKHQKLIKVGRTHLQDAVPISFAQEFDSYRQALTKTRKNLIQQSENLKTLGIGGTAVGTGINTDPKYKQLVIKELSKYTKLKLKPATNATESANNMNDFMNFSAALRSLATNLLNFSSDLKLMNMGPKAGLSEITLPEVQAGSSIMPGKVNPSIIECLEMISIQALGNDHSISIASQKSNFELNVMCPLIMYNLLQSMEILSNGVKMLREKALEKLVVNANRIEEIFNNSLVTATSLSPYIGYKTTAQVVKEALKNNRTIKEEVLIQKILSEKELKEILSPKRTTKPAKIDKKLVKKSQ